jgi:hypothetical protein
MMTSMEDIVKAAEAAGDTTFGETEMKTFRTRLSATVYPLRDLDPLQYPAGTHLQAEQATVYVTSERDNSRADNPRLYTVRLAEVGTTVREKDGREVPTFYMRRLTEFGEYRSLSGAHGFAKRYAAEHPRALKPMERSE